MGFGSGGMGVGTQVVEYKHDHEQKKRHKRQHKRDHKHEHKHTRKHRHKSQHEGMYEKTRRQQERKTTPSASASQANADGRYERVQRDAWPTKGVGGMRLGRTTKYGIYH